MANGGIPMRKFITYEAEELPYYLCTVYTKHPKGLDQAYIDAAKQLGLLLEHGYLVFCPIVHSHEAARWLYQYNHDFWLPIDKKFINISRGLIVCKMDNWEQSVGIAEEIKWARKMNKEILYCNFMELPCVE